MFKIATDPQFTHEVTVQTPVDGGHREDTFKARFRVVPEARYEEFNVGTRKGLVEFLRLAIVSIEDVIGEDDKPLSYNDGVRDALLDLPYARLALFKTYLAGVQKVRSGN